MSMMRRYAYVGPPEIRARAVSRPAGAAITRPADVAAWARASGQTLARSQPLAVTFVVDPTGRLLIADRHSEHVACAAGGDVLSAGEMFLVLDDQGDVMAAEVTNMSTGFCPEPESWAAVARALDAAGIGHPGEFTTAFVFRRCDACGQRNVVKDGWYRCDVCGATLPERWNFA